MNQSESLPNPIAALNFLKVAGDLKRTPRTGWVYSGVQERARVESVADHSWRMAAAAFLFSNDSSYNIGKMIQMAVLHDIAEAIIGDIAPADKVENSEKQRRERVAIEEIMKHLSGFSSIGAETARALIEEYELRESADSKAVKDLDLLEMVVQANEYELETGLDLSDFFRTTVGKFKTKQVISIMEELTRQRDTRKQASQAAASTETDAPPSIAIVESKRQCIESTDTKN